MELTSTNRSRAYPEGMGSKFWRKRLDSMFGFEGMDFICELFYLICFRIRFFCVEKSVCLLWSGDFIT